MEDMLFIHTLKYLNCLYENGYLTPNDLDKLAAMSLDFGYASPNYQLKNHNRNNGYPIPNNEMHEMHEIHDNIKEDYDDDKKT